MLRLLVLLLPSIVVGLDAFTDADDAADAAARKQLLQKRLKDLGGTKGNDYYAAVHDAGKELLDPAQRAQALQQKFSDLLFAQSVRWLLIRDAPRALSALLIFRP